MNRKFKLKTKSFQELSVNELYEILSLRSDVFVLEQTCLYRDIDFKDQSALHCLANVDDSIIVAYTRIFDLGGAYPDHLAIGRVLVNKPYRNLGYGQRIMEYSVEQCFKHFGKHPIKISAQTYLIDFYNDLGFQEQGSSYLEDDIPHISMIYKV